MPNNSDYSTYYEAEIVANQIRDYWRRQGFTIKTEVVKVAAEPGQPLFWGVRSNLVNGLPPEAA